MIVAQNITKQFGKPPISILHDINLEIQEGEFVSISGRSGSGKSTLLYILSTLDHPSKGSVLIDGKDVSKFSDKVLHSFRNEQIGFIFQFHYLIPELTALENILLPPRNIDQVKKYTDDAHELLERLDIKDVTEKFPSQMSGGQMQRVAIARALIMKPRYIFADEPTGNLDTANGDAVMKILINENKIRKTNICLVTHDTDYSKMASREIFLTDGRVTSE